MPEYSNRLVDIRNLCRTCSCGYFVLFVFRVKYLKLTPPRKMVMYKVGLYKVGLYKVGSLPVRNLSGDGVTQNTKLNTDALIGITTHQYDL